MSNKIILTREGLQLLKDKISRLEQKINSHRESLARAIDRDGIYDDQYHERFESMLYREEELKQLNELLSRAVVVEDIHHDGSNRSVEVGSRVRLVNHRLCYKVQVVSEIEADPFAGKITPDSPIGNSIIGRGLGEVVYITTPTGVIDFKITEITR